MKIKVNYEVDLKEMPIPLPENFSFTRFSLFIQNMTKAYLDSELIGNKANISEVSLHMEYSKVYEEEKTR